MRASPATYSRTSVRGSKDVLHGSRTSGMVWMCWDEAVVDDATMMMSEEAMMGGKDKRVLGMGAILHPSRCLVLLRLRGVVCM